jgi:methyl-accepting chemotaxis protein
LLALNAVVEAAREGTAGKGFLVIEAVVRKLAEQSKSAAKEIISLTDICLQYTLEPYNNMEELVPEIEKTILLVKEISSASIEQKRGSDQINNTIQRLYQTTSQNTASAESMASTSTKLMEEAEDLKKSVKLFFVLEEKKC